VPRDPLFFVRLAQGFENLGTAGVAEEAVRVVDHHRSIATGKQAGVDTERCGIPFKPTRVFPKPISNRVGLCEPRSAGQDHEIQVTMGERVDVPTQLGVRSYCG
jgi:hypothetical protein